MAASPDLYVVCAGAGPSDSEIEAAKVATHNKLVAETGARRCSGVEWHITYPLDMAKDEDRAFVAKLIATGPADLALAGWLRTHPGCVVVIASAEIEEDAPDAPD